MHSVNPGPFIGLVAVIGIFSIPMLGMICHFAHEMVKAWLAIGLKRDMVARGYTAQEIVEVVAAEAGSKTRSFLPNVPPAKPVKQPAYSP
jgi:hypothetical protein